MIGVTQLLVAMVSLLFSVTASAAEFAGTASGVVERVVDGDTVKMRVGIWLDQEVLISVRVAGIDAPELFRPKCAAERQLAGRAKAFAEEFLSGGNADLMDIQRGKYAGRVVARIEVDGNDLGDALVAAGLAYRGKRGNWCTQ